MTVIISTTKRRVENPKSGSGDYRIFDFKAARESAFTEEERSYGLGRFLGIGSRHIQLAGGHITMGFHQDSGCSYL